jgi:hypothetical protein
MLGECQTLLFNLFVQARSLNRWQWKLDPSKGVRDAYRFFTSHDSMTFGAAEDLV